jgi:hypothetical protein
MDLEVSYGFIWFPFNFQTSPCWMLMDGGDVLGASAAQLCNANFANSICVDHLRQVNGRWRRGLTFMPGLNHEH